MLNYFRISFITLFFVLNIQTIYSQFPPHPGLGKKYTGGQVGAYTTFD